MTEYLVRWEIQLDADSPEEAARTALAWQRDSDSTATAFTVYGPDMIEHTIDLSELDSASGE